MTPAERTLRVRGLPNPAAWAYFCALWLSGDPPVRDLPKIGGRLVLVRSKEDDLEDLSDSLTALDPLFPGAGLAGHAFFGQDAHLRLASRERLRRGARIVLATAESLEGPGLSDEDYEARRLVFHMGGTYPRKDVLSRLAALGYRRADFAESPGEYAVRGAVADFYPWEPLKPVRLLFDGDTVETIREYDPQTQTAGTGLQAEAVAIPATETGTANPLKETLSGGIWLAEEAPGGLPAGAARVLVSLASSGSDFGAKPVFTGGLGGLRVDAAAEFFRERAGRGFQLRLFSMNRGEDERLREMLEERLPAGTVRFHIGPLRHGFECADRKAAFLSSSEIFGRSYRTRRELGPSLPPRSRARWGELKKGDYVVHEQYGIARYLGLEEVLSSAGPLDEPASFKREDGTRRLGRPSDEPVRSRPQKVMDCLRLAFRGGDSIFVPMAEFKCVQKYIGAEGHRPKLSSLDTRSWKEVKERVREGVRDLARQLLKLQAERKALKGHAFAEDTHMEAEFAESFPYEETPDQRKAIEEVKADMRSREPMDRVVVGDVGFGKTEVAMRATLKCVAGLKQAAVMVPTTILADQHARTFKSRFAEYPVRIELLSRFQTPAAQKNILKGLAEGAVDVVIGTHRLLSKDIKFRDLGLLVIDEEHRFGVRAKEKIKALKQRVDCLLLSATPIPRTLHQCLSGLRKVSMIQSAPTGRQPIATCVEPWSKGRVVEAVERELQREGQVYYVHNRVRSLPETRKKLEELLPGLRVCVAHGRMRSRELEKTMWDFFQRKYDVLLASSIIESGLDIPSVNTLLIENAQDFGLSQLYQLRGRIGRERRRAYCHLFYPADKKELGRLSEEARKRLEAMRDFVDLGSGLLLAMRDLEIRGAGELLGAKQHGFLNAVGVEFYSELLNEEVRRLEGGKAAAGKAEPSAHLDLDLPAYIPESYLPGDLERIQFYKRILAAGPEAAEELKKRLTDLSGPMPAAVVNLFRVMEMRADADRAKVRVVIQRGSRLEVYFRKDAAVPVEAVGRWMGSYGDKIEFISSEEGDGLRVIVSQASPAQWLADFLRGLVKPY